MSEDVLQHALVYFLAAVLSVPVAKRMGLGSVLGYLIAGVLIGPYVLRLTTQESGHVMHFAEFGVVMMLFLVGLELRPALLWELRSSILGMGGLQVVGTTFAVAGVGMFFGFDWKIALAVGMILAMSSTAIVLQSLNEKGLLKTQGGQACFSVLLFQDIAVIPILALLPLLATRGSGGASAEPVTGIHALPGYLQAGLVFLAVGGIILAGRFLLRPFFRYIAETNLREVFTATTLLLVVGITLVMEKVGLSAALGTFLAGVVLAESEYRHQLEADIEPFKGLLLGLFFISVGAGINFSLLTTHGSIIVGVVLGLVLLKLLVLLAVGQLFGLQRDQNALFGLALAQGGEFAFVLLAFATDNRVLPASISDVLVVSVAISMAITPILLIINERVVQPKLAKTINERSEDEIDEHDNPVILAGFGRVGHVVGRLLRYSGVGTTVLDFDADQVETFRQFGIKSFYGDASREDMLRAAGVAKAKLLVIAIDDEEKSLQIVDLVQREFPNLEILARATSLEHLFDLRARGVKRIYRETFASALEMGVDALRFCGFRATQAHRAAHLFRQGEEQAMDKMMALRNDDSAYLSEARQHLENLQNVLRHDMQAQRVPDENWDIQDLIREVTEKTHPESKAEGTGTVSGG